VPQQQLLQKQQQQHQQKQQQDAGHNGNIMGDIYLSAIPIC